jgi:hypothetical protein
MIGIYEMRSLHELSPVVDTPATVLVGDAVNRCLDDGHFLFLFNLVPQFVDAPHSNESVGLGYVLHESFVLIGNQVSHCCAVAF